MWVPCWHCITCRYEILSLSDTSFSQICQRVAEVCTARDILASTLLLKVPLDPRAMTMTPEQFVEAIGTGDIIHNSGDLFGDHLRSVQRVLKEWGEDEELQLAGLFHSIYGTEGFQDFQLSFDRRDDIKSLIGEVRAHGVKAWYCLTRCQTSNITACRVLMEAVD